VPRSIRMSNLSPFCAASLALQACRQGPATDLPGRSRYPLELPGCCARAASGQMATAPTTSLSVSGCSIAVIMTRKGHSVLQFRLACSPSRTR
jgi:hypothetical protein